MEIDRYNGGIVKDMINRYNLIYTINNYPLKNHFFSVVSFICKVKNCERRTNSICGICYDHHPIQKAEDYPCWVFKNNILT